MSPAALETIWFRTHLTSFFETCFFFSAAFCASSEAVMSEGLFEETDIYQSQMTLVPWVLTYSVIRPGSVENSNSA